MTFLITLEELQSARKNPSSGHLSKHPNIGAAIKTLRAFLKPQWPVLERLVPNLSPPSDQLLWSTACIVECSLEVEVFEWYKDTVTRCFSKVEEEIKQMTIEWTDSADYHPVLRLLSRWHLIYLTWYEPLRILAPNLVFSKEITTGEAYRKHFCSLLLPCIPTLFPSGLKKLFTEDLMNSILFAPQSTDSNATPIQQLASLGLLEPFQPIIFSVGYEAIDERIESVCRGVWNDSEACLEGVLAWFRKVVGLWLFKIFESGVVEQEGEREQAIAIMRPAISRFEYHIYKCISELRISELFDIIVDFPESLPAVQDLRLCLSKTEQRSLLVHTLQESNRKRLLHPGADTQDIITQYISLMKALRVLDPPGVLLSCVGQPVRTYLRSREDTIRCIVTSLVEPGHSLGDELDQASFRKERVVSASGAPFAIEEEIDYSLPVWTPDPVDAPAGYKNGLKEDAIESLVSIYENRDGFVKELQVLLASRLLAVKGFDVSLELARVEILKLKFGEVSLQPCDIMLKDLADSKRADTSVHQVAPGLPIHVIIISHFFWPELASSTFRSSPRLIELQKSFENAYSQLKVDRRLRWMTQLGTVELDIELEDRMVSVEVSTLQASVIELFELQDTWTIEKLAKTLRLMNEPSHVRNALYFWSNHEVLKEIESGVWKLFESVEAFNLSAVRTSRHVIEEPPRQIDSSQAKVEKIRVFSAFILGMLKNLGSLPLERIYMTLNTVMPAFKGTTRDELGSLLESMQREGSVVVIGELWKMVK
ncbi:hypothetical protein CROQUDRAFT_64206 [Cronartium quercuum f. sp. fusiforme G11]|uniref:Anaphase-promoting complex subunit 2 n=1 Tax=Cronartium quercuum f. sp. fusiforme G11 TaxID=708437 RepID=A0A9P6TB16_9BASI|nr:hypothetical protein CROQUDRAFT_64206 [Cronartium quercuum f. sp. fusiforme G11]